MARGDLLSYPIEDLLERVRSSFENDGVKELWLTSEDVGAWGRDIGLVIYYSTWFIKIYRHDVK
jgi:threonylcarbamoyladenosine tRNA methylthiotransferase CDKAL1